MANDKDFVVKNAVEVGGSTKTTLGSITENVQQTSYDIANASYDSKSFSVSSQDTGTRGFTFKSDGTEMYLVAFDNDAVYQYTLSTAWDISTASYSSKSFSITSQDTQPHGVQFKSDGTKMFVVTQTSNNVYQYSLSTAWDVSTASYDGVGFSISTQVGTNNVSSLLFSADGTNMYVGGTSTDTVYQYTLSTAWDLSTASYASKSLSVASEDTSPRGTFFKPDGSVLFVVGISDDEVLQYSLTTPWDLSTASFDNTSFSVLSQDSSPMGVHFSTNGDKMFILGNTNDNVFQYSTASYADQINLDTGNYFAHSPSGTTTYTISNAATNQSFQLEVTGGAEEVAQIFNTTIYAGTSAAKTITNNIDLSTDGGLVWIKVRTTTGSHVLFDTERGATKYVSSNSIDAEATQATSLTAFNTDGFSLGSLGEVNENNQDLVAWTFKKEPKFFDVVTYTGTGSGIKTVDHNLGSAPAIMLVKKLNVSSDWLVFSKDTSAPHNKYLILNGTASEQNYDNIWGENGYLPTTTQFKVQHLANESGGNYVAYLFANDTASDGLIQCSSYTGNGSATGPTITLGWKPQWIMVKRTDSTGYWTIVDSVRGMVTSGDDKLLYPNTTDAEQQSNRFIPTDTGFQVNSTNSNVNANGGTYIYMAIRNPADLDLTWPTSIEWAGGVAPAAPATGETDLFSISTDDGGTTYQGFKTADNLS
jgi:hypothetical protein